MKNIIEEVLKDFREGDGQFSDKLMSEEGWQNYDERYDIYRNINKSRRTDADHWKRAIDSYMSYPCFKRNNNYYWSKSAIFFDDGSHFVSISADILTNEGIVENWIKHHEKENLSKYDLQVISAFKRVTYTVGNFCPIWRNGGSGTGTGNDNVWYKLKNGGAAENTEPNIQERENLMPPNKRKMKDLFRILPQGENYVTEFFFCDYYNDKGDLKWTKECYVPKLKKEDFIEFIRLTTVLIIQRGYRIIKGIQEKELTANKEYNQDELKYIFKEIGLKGLNFF